MQRQIAAQKDSLADGPSENGADMNALFAEMNNLPADDPLRAACECCGCCGKPAA